MTLGQRIRYYRQLNGISQESLGEKIKADARTISNYETGKYNPSTNNIIALAKVFGISTDQLLLNSNQNNEKKLQLKKEWAKLFLEVEYLPEKDRNVLKNLIHLLIEKNKKG